eukprot:1158483-Pelagomonas_calceolata.AAC.6
MSAGHPVTAAEPQREILNALREAACAARACLAQSEGYPVTALELPEKGLTRNAEMLKKPHAQHTALAWAVMCMHRKKRKEKALPEACAALACCKMHVFRRNPGAEVVRATGHMLRQFAKGEAVRLDPSMGMQGAKEPACTQQKEITSATRSIQRREEAKH